MRTMSAINGVGLAKSFFVNVNNCPPHFAEAPPSPKKRPFFKPLYSFPRRFVLYPISSSSLIPPLPTSSKLIGKSGYFSDSVWIV